MTIVLAGKTFKLLIDAISIVNEECKWNFKDNGLDFKVVNRERTMMLDFFSVFYLPDTYKEGKTIAFRIDKKLKEVCHKIKSYNAVYLEINENKLTLQYNGISYNIELLDPQSIKDFPRPNITPVAKAVMSVKQFKDMINTMKASENNIVTIEIDGIGITMLKGEGVELSLKHSYGKYELEELEWTGEKIKSTYQFPYLSKIAKVLPNDKNGKIELSLNSLINKDRLHILCLRYRSATTCYLFDRFEFLVAPYLES